MFKEKEIKKREYVLIFCALCLGIILFCLLLYFNESYIHKVEIVNYAPDNILEYCIDSVEMDEYITVNGWSYVPGENINTYDCNILLQEIGTENIYILPTTMVDRTDVTQSYDDGYNYNHSGFMARARLGQFNYANKDYEIIIRYFNNENEYYVKTSKTVSKEITTNEE